MRNKWVLTVLLLTLWQITQTNGQPNYNSAPSEPSRNFYDVRNEFIDWHANSSLPDSILAREAKRFGRFEYFWAPRVGSNDSATSGLFSNWAIHINTYLNSSWSDTYCTNPDLADWKSLGPYPVSSLMTMGFVGAIWCDPDDPNFIIIGSGRKGGIMRTTDRNKWEDVTSPQRLPVCGVRSIAVSPNRVNGKRVIYAGTGHDYSIGIIKSSDDGDTWEILENFPHYAQNKFSYQVFKVLVPQNLTSVQSDIIYAVADNTFYSSDDGGVNWVSYLFPNTTGRLCDIVVDPADYTKITVSSDGTSSQRAQVWVSEDGGISWTEVLGNLPSQFLYPHSPSKAILSQPSSLRLYVYSDHSYTNSSGQKVYDRKVFFSENKGITWNLETGNYAPTYGGQFNYAFEVSRDHSTIFIGTEYFVVHGNVRIGYLTTANTHCDIRCFQLIYDSNNNVSRILVGSDGGVSESLNNGLNWSTLNIPGENGLVNNEIFGLDVSEASENIVAGLMDNGMTILKDNQYSFHGGVGDGEKVVFHPENQDEFLALTNCVLYHWIPNGISYNMYYTWEPCINCYDYANTNTWLGRPLVIGEKYPYYLYTGLKGGQINRRNLSISNSQWETITLDLNAIPANRADVVAIRIAPNDPSIVYAATRNSNTNAHAIYRSNSYGADGSWIDITGNLNNLYVSITDIAIDSDNPNRIWITKDGIWFNNGTAYNRVFRCDNASQGAATEWHEMTYDLPSLPVTAIVHQPGTTDRVFIATDAGIFFWDGVSNRWECFSSGMPMAFVTQLKINRKNQTIYASTFGRGIWKSKLPCLESQQSVICDASTGDLNWDKDKYIGGDILVASGHTLTISNDAIISMGNNSKIMVMEGGMIVVNNGTITSGCNGMWQGIELQGDCSELQSDATKGVVKLLNGAVIENAIIGISTRTQGSQFVGSIPGTGGIIQAENATFRNCETAIQMHPFKNNGSHYATSIDQSYFRNCTFVTDDDFLLKGVTSPTHMDLNGIYQLRVQGCTFRNNETPPVPSYLYHSLNGTGIMALDASVVVTPLCTTQTVPCGGEIRNQFINLHHAIHITQPLTTQGYSSMIKEADFTGNYRAVYANSPQLLQVKQCSLVNNYRGVYLLNSQGAMVEGNHVEIAEAYETSALGYPYGLYLDAGHGFSVEGNNFINTHTVNASYGIVVNNTGAKNNEIYLNIFTGLKVGIQPQFRNKGKINNEELGLCLFCNKFNNPDTWDIWVAGKANSVRKKNIGINVAQQISDGTTQFPAGNLFSPGHLLLPQNPNAYNDFSNLDADHLIYAYDPNSTNGRMEPYVYSNITLYPRQSGATQCMPKTGNILNLSQGYVDLVSAQLAFNSSGLIRDIWKNGGIEDLQQQVELVLPWEAYQQYNELISISPYVAADALIAMIQNPSFTDLMVKLVCVANPHSSRNDAVLEALYHRILPMPEQYIEEILDESGSYSPLDELEGNAAADYHLVRMIENEILRLYYADTVNLWVTDSITQFLSRLPGLEDRYTYALHCLRTGDLSTMQTTLDDIPLQFELSERENLEYEYLTEVFAILEAIKEYDLQPGDLIGEQTEPLILMLETEGTVDKSLAIAILLWNDPDFEYNEPILEPTGYQMRKTKPQKAIATDVTVMRLYPNPARDYFTVFYKVPESQRNSLSLQVKDATGRIVLQQPLLDNAFEYMIDTGILTKGVFTVVLLNNNRLLTAEKLVIIK
jgi:hypothetical protein